MFDKFDWTVDKTYQSCIVYSIGSINQMILLASAFFRIIHIDWHTQNPINEHKHTTETIYIYVDDLKGTYFQYYR